MNDLNALKYLVNMKQGPLEGYGGYIKRARSAIKTLTLAGGSHVLCSPAILEAADQAKP